MYTASASQMSNNVIKMKNTGMRTATHWHTQHRSSVLTGLLPAKRLLRTNLTWPAKKKRSLFVYGHGSVCATAFLLGFIWDY